MRGRVHVGTSGWIYKHWDGAFYPPELPKKRQLAYLASKFSTVEVNGTFYSLSRPHCFARWRSEVGPGFVFAIKGSRYITHMLKLKAPRTPLANFFAQGVLLLGAQLGPILWQLPPMLGFDGERARTFLDALPRDLDEAERLARKHDERLNHRAALRAPDGHGTPLRHAFEIRHASWLCEEALQLLCEYGVALVTADTADHHPLSLERTTDAFAYVRLHGSRALYASEYTDDELDGWAALVDGWRARGSDVYVYFDNDNKAYAPGDAQRLLARLHAVSAPVDARAWRRRSLLTREEAHMALSTDKIIEELGELIRYDYDAIGAYTSAIDDIKEMHVRDPLVQFRGDHERHVQELSAIVRQLGGDPPEKLGLKGVIRKTMTKVAGLGGTELTLKAMRSNEEVLNKTYAHHLALDFPNDIKEVIRKNYGDEQRHLAWIEQALQTRLWETAVGAHP